MNNLSFSKKFSPQHDNGERNLCWIKCSDRLPEYSSGYIVTLDTGMVTTALWQNGKFQYCGDELKVIAYMKFPSPYKPD